MHEVLVNRLGGLSLPRKSVVRLTDRPDMTLDVYRGRKTTMQHATSISFLINIGKEIPFRGSVIMPYKFLTWEQTDHSIRTPFAILSASFGPIPSL